MSVKEEINNNTALQDEHEIENHEDVKNFVVGEEMGRRKRTTSRKTFVKFFVITFLACVAVIASGLGIWNMVLDSHPLLDDNKVPEKEPPKTEEKLDVLVPAEGMFATEFKDSKRVNVLLLGNTKEKLSDTIMLASFDPEQKKVDLISIPRDTYYEREGYGASYLKINAVFQEGPLASAKAVHDVLLGVPINYYAIVSYEGVKKIVDSVGGVPFDVPRDMHYVKKSENLIIDLKKGQQVLDGDHAVQYIRYRHGYSNGDVGRAEAQQMFVKAAIKQVMTLQNLPAAAKSIVDNVTSDITPRAALYAAQNSSGLSDDKVNAWTLPGVGVSKYLAGLSFYVRSDNSVIEAMMREIYSGEKAVTGGAITGGAVSDGAVSG